MGPSFPGWAVTGGAEGGVQEESGALGRGQEEGGLSSLHPFQPSLTAQQAPKAEAARGTQAAGRA